jgi:hypothetical protein
MRFAGRLHAGNNNAGAENKRRGGGSGTVRGPGGFAKMAVVSEIE